MADDPQKTPAAKPPWYLEGLRFECVPDCGGCCTNHGDYAYVYLEGGDLRRLAEHLELTDREFSDRYTEVGDGYRVLLMDRPECPFLEGMRCGVYPARPTQCRTFPFWSENLATPEDWKKAAKISPGIDNGRLHQLGDISRLTAGQGETG